MNASFAGDKKVGKNILSRAETVLINRYIDRVPLWLETYHLTLMTIGWSAGVIIFGYLTRYNWHWLWATSLMIILQYITDLFDGAVGRKRNTGLIKWGYYMDHFLDYIFLCSLLIGYAFIIPASFFNMYFFILAILGSFMVNSYLAFAATNQFRISYLGIGPTEIRLLFLVIDLTLIIFGKTYIAWSLPTILIITVIGLCITVYRTQKEIWEIDMKKKKKQ
ncbi:MAG TPA: CDP-alcohol phosphatidyltransferase family protein [Patescibacteria group bacterium]|nr:CDP-alcohol phosphatidyltransferase family protein [Patescibacteria group bacterium]